MRALLPITQEDQERLSYLHSMSAICTYVRKSVLFQGKSSNSSYLLFFNVFKNVIYIQPTSLSNKIGISLQYHRD